MGGVCWTPSFLSVPHVTLLRSYWRKKEAIHSLGEQECSMERGTPGNPAAVAQGRPRKRPMAVSLLPGKGFWNRLPRPAALGAGRTWLAD